MCQLPIDWLGAHQRSWIISKLNKPSLNLFKRNKSNFAKIIESASIHHLLVRITILFGSSVKFDLFSTGTCIVVLISKGYISFVVAVGNHLLCCFRYCNDYDVEIVDLDPNSGDVLCVAVVLVMATVLTKRVSQYQTYSISSLQRHQYQVRWFCSSSSFRLFLTLSVFTIWAWHRLGNGE